MKRKILRSYCKINLFLDVGKKIKKHRLHNIQSLIFLMDLHDKITIQKNNSLKDEVSFSGKFKSYIKNKNNSITKSLSLLRKNKLIKANDNYSIAVEKNIPVFSGFGGGSSNAATVIKHFIKGKKISTKYINYFCKFLGSDLRLFFGYKKIFQKNLFEINEFKKKHTFYFILVYPFIKSSTKNIYSNLRTFKRLMNKNNYSGSSKLKIIDNLKFEENSLEKIVVSKFPVVKKVLYELELIKNCQFSRVTGSGSACFGLFLTKTSANLGLRKIKKKFPKFWCVVGKTI